MENTQARPTTDTLWTRAATLLAAFVRAYLSAAQFAKMQQAPAILVADALTRVRRIEALARRVLFAQALALRVEVKPVRPAGTARSGRATPVETPLDSDPSTWRVRFSVPLPALTQPPRPQTPRAWRFRHPILPRPERLARLPQAHRAYDPVSAARYRARVRARAAQACHDDFYAPWPPPKPDGPKPECPGWFEVPPSNQPVDMTPTAAIARRIEALHRVIADPAPYAQRLAARLARAPTRAARVLAHWRARTRRVEEGEETLRLAEGNFRGPSSDSS